MSTTDEWADCPRYPRPIWDVVSYVHDRYFRTRKAAIAFAKEREALGDCVSVWRCTSQAHVDEAPVYENCIEHA